MKRFLLVVLCVLFGSLAFAPTASAGHRVTSRNLITVHWDKHFHGKAVTLTANPDMGDCSDTRGTSYVIRIDTATFVWNNVGLNISSISKTTQAPGCNYVVMFYHTPEFFGVHPHGLGICGAGPLPMADVGWLCDNNVGDILIEHHNM